MKKKLVFAVAIFACSSMFGTVTFELNAGPFYDDKGVEIPEGSLIQLLYLTEGNTALSTSPLQLGSFLHENEEILHSFYLDSTFAGVQGMITDVKNFSLTGDFVAGSSLALRWWPTLDSTATAPSAGDVYGQTNPLYLVGWITPADGGGVQLNYLSDVLLGGDGTGSAGGVPSSALFANYQVIPEPSTYALGGVGLLGALVALCRRRHA